MKVIIDIETSGLDPEKHGIMSIGILPIDENIAPFYAEVKTDRVSDYTALAINGLSCECGQEPAEVVKKFLKWLQYTKIDCLEVIGHNFLRFDLPFLKNEFPEIVAKFSIKTAIVDTIMLAQVLRDASGGKLFKSRSLKCCAEAFGIDYSGAHNAAEDCRITRIIYLRMMEIFEIGLADYFFKEL